MASTCQRTQTPFTPPPPPIPRAKPLSSCATCPNKTPSTAGLNVSDYVLAVSGFADGGQGRRRFELNLGTTAIGYQQLAASAHGRARRPRSWDRRVPQEDDPKTSQVKEQFLELHGTSSRAAATVCAAAAALAFMIPIRNSDYQIMIGSSDPNQTSNARRRGPRSRERDEHRFDRDQPSELTGADVKKLLVKKFMREIEVPIAVPKGKVDARGRKTTVSCVGGEYGASWTRPSRNPKRRNCGS